MIEEWKTINEFPDYQISNLGRVKSFKRNKEIILKQSKDKDGYFRVNLCVDGKIKKRHIHSLIYITFINELDKNKCVHHKDKNKENNCMCNLIEMNKSEHSSLHSKNMSEETRNKISESHKGSILSEEHRRNIGKASKGRICSEETREKISKANKGYKHTDETRKKMSESGKIKIFTEEHKKNISKSNKGKIRSEEIKEKLRILNTGRKHTEESKKKMSESGKVKIFTEEHRRNIGKANEGELHPNHKLTNEQIFEIKKLLVEGNLSQAKIAILFNVQGNAISRIKNGKTWKHIII